ncbi:MFS transporter [Ktedonobacter robiniae]|uniref:Tetracycline resistance MFS efflux pump n=1 Tax=Ktedonobacter robiniae TaxID=2778365 RepID=A0ABQ3UGZ7_9CHLR|nr:MFS transporter [Ktedonobacter robiniae]GHO51983.1 tetracycline resistance MFS efflux pump [Ktedonobacter robiniae]
MQTTHFDNATTPTLEEAVLVEPGVVPPGKQTRSITLALTFLIGCVTLIMTGFAIIIPVFPQRLQALGLGPETLALMEGAFGLGMFLFSTPMGTWAGRIGRKPILFISLAGFIGTNIALAFVNVPLLFILIRFVEGMLISGLMPVAMAMIGDTIPLERQGRWIGFVTTAQAVGIALGPGIGGFLYQSLGFTSPFLFSAGIALAASLLAIFMVPETLPDAVRLEARQPKAKSGSIASNKQDLSLLGLVLLFLPFLVIDFGMIFTYPFVFPQYPFFFEKVLHYSAAQYGIIISTYGLALAVFPLFLGRLSETLPKKPLIVIGSLLFGGLNLFMFVAPFYPLLLLGSVLGGLGSALVQPAMGSIYLGATTDKNRGQVMGIRGSAISLAVMLGPLTQALVGHWITPQTTFAIGVALSLGMAGVAFALLKSPQQTTEA